jgi:hypothetical protein
MNLLKLVLCLILLVGCVDRTRRWKVIDSNGKEYKNLIYLSSNDSRSVFEDLGGKSYVFSGNFTVLED